jgi:hypothetical protein
MDQDEGLPFAAYDIMQFDAIHLGGQAFEAGRWYGRFGGLGLKVQVYAEEEGEKSGGFHNDAKLGRREGDGNVQKMVFDV